MTKVIRKATIKERVQLTLITMVIIMGATVTLVNGVIR